MVLIAAQVWDQVWPKLPEHAGRLVMSVTALHTHFIHGWTYAWLDLLVGRIHGWLGWLDERCDSDW